MSSSTSTPYLASSRIFNRQDVPSTNRPADVSPSASPPLILAFLAIGIFALSMIGVFGWRRFQYARIRGEIPGHEWQAGHNERPSRTGLGPRPKLWDLWAIDLKDDHKRNKGFRSTSDFDMTAETWNTIMPISVVVTPPHLTKSDGTTSQTPEPAAVPFYRWTRHIDPTATTAEKNIPRAKVNGSNENDERRIQVAVAIAMPSQQTPHDITTNARGMGLRKAESDDTFAYTLGVYECVWGHDNG